MVAALLVAVALLSPPGGGERAVGEAARSCTPPSYPGEGYFTSLTVKGVGCTTGRRVTLAHYRCRTRSGKAGRCVRRVLRYSCREKRQSIETEIDGRVTCRRGSATVTYTYQQDI